jgi:hypothetical protein
MRSFRFSRFAMVFMVLALIGVGIAIDTARRQAVSGFVVEQPAWVIFSRSLVGLLEAMAILGGILGGIGYVVLRGCQPIWEPAIGKYPHLATTRSLDAAGLGDTEESNVRHGAKIVRG